MSRRSEHEVDEKGPSAGVQPVDRAETAQLPVSHAHWYIQRKHREAANHVAQ